MLWPVKLFKSLFSAFIFCVFSTPKKSYCRRPTSRVWKFRSRRVPYVHECRFWLILFTTWLLSSCRRVFVVLCSIMFLISRHTSAVVKYASSLLERACPASRHQTGVVNCRRHPSRTLDRDCIAGFVIVFACFVPPYARFRLYCASYVRVKWKSRCDLPGMATYGLCVWVREQSPI